MDFYGVCILTDDVIRLTKFYEFILEDKSEGDDTHMFFQNSKLAIWNPGSAKVAKDKNMILMYYVDDVDAMFKRIIDSNFEVTVLEEPSNKSWGTRAFALLDPDGNQTNFLTNI